MRLFQTTLFSVLGLACLLATAQPRESVEGRHYQALPQPVQTETDEDVIEVRELFWYGCPECAVLSPMMTDWRDGVTGDLTFNRMPVIWNEVMELHARLFYSARALDTEDLLHPAAFVAIHEEGRPLRTEEGIREFVASLGISGEDFDAAWTSETVLADVEQARRLSQAYATSKLPAVIINGRYAVTQNEFVENHTELNIAVNMVVRKLRNERRSDI